jgi:uncharacterized protein HemY
MILLSIIVIYVIGCIVATVLGALENRYCNSFGNYPVEYSFLSWVAVVAIVLVFLCDILCDILELSEWLRNLYKWVYNFRNRQNKCPK